MRLFVLAALAASPAFAVEKSLPKPLIPQTASASVPITPTAIGGIQENAPVLSGVDYTNQGIDQAHQNGQSAKPVLDRAFSGAEITSPNAVTAQSFADTGAVGRLYVNASHAGRGQLNAVVNAVRHTDVKVIGRFERHDDAYLKPKLDEGLHGAVLQSAESLKDVLRFLKRLYLPPLGARTVGPSDVTSYLRKAKDFIAGGTQEFEGGVQIATDKGAQNIDAILKAKNRGLKFIELGPGLSVAARERVQAAAATAGVAIQTVVATDLQAVSAAWSKTQDVAADPALDPAPRQTIAQWIKAGKIGQLGFLNTPDVNLARLFSDRAHALWIDAEAGHFTPQSVAEIISSLPAGRQVAVRAAEYNDPAISEFIKAGAQAIVAPTINYAWQAKAFVAAVKRANPKALAIVMIETKEGLRDVENIARVPGIDLLFIGPNDLALSLGTTQESQEFAAAIARIEAAGLPLGGLAKSRAHAYALHAKGYRFVTTVMDQVAVAKHFR